MAPHATVLVALRRQNRSGGRIGEARGRRRGGAGRRRQLWAAVVMACGRRVEGPGTRSRPGDVAGTS
eukprot:2389582-Prymnesium_polylepis.1